MGLKKELTVQSCTATRLTYFKIRQRVGSCYHRSLWQTAPCVFVRQHRSGPFHLTATLHPAPLLYRRGKWTPFYPLWSKVMTQFDIPQKYFKDQRRKCGDLLEKTCSAPPPPPNPLPCTTTPQKIISMDWGSGGGWCHGYKVKWPLTTKMFAKSLFPCSLFSWQNTNSSYSSLNLCDLSFQKNRCNRPDLPSSHHRCSHMIVSSIFWLHLERIRHDPEDCKGTRLRFQQRRDDRRSLKL